MGAHPNSPRGHVWLVLVFVGLSVFFYSFFFQSIFFFFFFHAFCFFLCLSPSPSPALLGRCPLLESLVSAANIPHTSS